MEQVNLQQKKPWPLWLKWGFLLGSIDLLIYILAYYLGQILFWSGKQISFVILILIELVSLLNLIPVSLTNLVISLTPTKYYPPGYLLDGQFPILSDKPAAYILRPYLNFVFAAITYFLIGAVIGIIIQKLKTRKAIQ